MIRIPRSIVTSILLLAARLVLGGQTAAASADRQIMAIAQPPASAGPTLTSLTSADPLTNTVFLPLVARPPLPDLSFETQVVTLTNAERAKAGCPALTISAQLSAAAEGHSNDMATHDFFSHTGSDGSTPWDRIRDTGYSFVRAAENIAAGYSSPAAVVQGWMASPGHRDNILNCDLTEIGVGYVYMDVDTGTVNYHAYWTQGFATPHE